MAETTLPREAIILAGGMGTRLRPLVSDLPKPLAPVHGRPFLEYLLDYLLGYDYRRVILSVGYKHQLIREHFGRRYRTLDLDYAVEAIPLGTGGAIREALRLAEAPQVTILNGDSYFPVDLDAMATQHLASGDALTMALRRVDDCSRYGSVRWHAGRIDAFLPRGATTPGYINGGIYLLRRALLEHLPATGAFSFEGEFLPRVLEELRMAPFVSTAYFIDIGIPDDYRRAQAEFAHLQEQPT